MHTTKIACTGMWYSMLGTSGKLKYFTYITPIYYIVTAFLGNFNGKTSIMVTLHHLENITYRCTVQVIHTWGYN